MTRKLTEQELDTHFYREYRKWEKKYKASITDKTDREITIMEPVFFSWGEESKNE